MQHTYEITRSDVFWTHLMFSFYSRIVMAFMVVLALIVGVQFFVIVELPGASLAARIIVACLFTGLMFLLLLLGQVLLSLLVATLRRHEGFLGRHALVLGEGGLIERTEYNESLHRWSRFFKVRKSVGYLYIFVTETLYHPVPKRSFASQEELERFLAELMRRIETAGRSA